MEWEIWDYHGGRNLHVVINISGEPAASIIRIEVGWRSSSFL
jgi:hypothetical protein